MMFTISEVFYSKEIALDAFFKRLPLNKTNFSIINGTELYYIDDIEAFMIPPKVYLNKETKFYNNRNYYVSTQNHVFEIDDETEKIVISASFDIGGHGGRYTEVDYKVEIKLENFEVDEVIYKTGKTYNGRTLISQCLTAGLP